MRLDGSSFAMLHKALDICPIRVLHVSLILKRHRDWLNVTSDPKSDLAVYSEAASSTTYPLTAGLRIVDVYAIRTVRRPVTLVLFFGSWI